MRDQTNGKLNFVFFGTPDVASKTLEILKQAGFLPSLIITSPDARSGRNMILNPPPAKTWAIENAIPYLQPEKLDTTIFTDTFDLFIVVAYGKIIPEDVLNIPRLGSLNIHYSLLPKYRGASPVESAILNGDTETGIAIQKMKFKLDSGNLIALEKTSIYPNEKTPELRHRLIEQGAQLLVNILPKFINGETIEIIQDETKATFCKKIKKEDGLVDLEKDTPAVLYNKFRAYTPWPRLFFFQNGKRIIITDAALENEKFIIKKVIPEGKKKISWEQFNKTNTSQ